MSDGAPVALIKPAEDTYADFRTRAVSSEAITLIRDIVDQAVVWEQERKQEDGQQASVRGAYKRGAAGLKSLRGALARFVGHLLIAKADPTKTGKVYRSLKKDGFSGGPVTYNAFTSAWKALEALELVSRSPGAPRFHSLGFDNKPMHLDGMGRASIFEATPKLDALAHQHGVALEDIHRHFEPEQDALQLRAYSKWKWSPRSEADGGTAPTKVRGAIVSFEPSERTAELEAQVTRLNDFLRNFTIRGGRFYGFFRGFNRGQNASAFNWDRGGRLYAYGQGTYQSMPGEQRALITIDGEPTVEIDISASYLTVFHGLVKAPFDPREGTWERIDIDNKQVAKDWINISLANGTELQKWPSGTVADYRSTGIELARDYPIKHVRRAALMAFPALTKLEGSGLTWAELMYAEAEAIMITMTRLIDKGVPCLPVFDSIIVPLPQVRLAAGVLYDAFYQRVGRPPLLKSKSALPGVDEQMAAAIAVDERWVNAFHL
ncbi:hypothetical protein [Rhodopseudomonas palustris]|uniref:hypothetical protein n=1 Tax=Rhodopseudomonas palustris TaxID=1076 RepID=UPI001F2BE71B|nr:hypothetical protein [Rhodopseudomonas palustris]